MKKNQNTESDSKLGKAIDAMEREAHMSAAEQAALEQDEDMKQACRDIACLEKVLLCGKGLTIFAWISWMKAMCSPEAAGVTG